MGYNRLATFAFGVQVGGLQRFIVTQTLYVGSALSVPSGSVAFRDAVPENWASIVQLAAGGTHFAPSRFDAAGNDVVQIVFSDSNYKALHSAGYTLHIQTGINGVLAAAKAIGQPPATYEAGQRVDWFDSTKAIYDAGEAWAQLAPGVPDPIQVWCETEQVGALSLIDIGTGEDRRERSLTIRTRWREDLLTADFCDLDGVRYAIQSFNEVGLRRELEFTGLHEPE